MSRRFDTINFDSQRTQFLGLRSGRVVVVETRSNRHQQLLCSGRHVMLAIGRRKTAARIPAPTHDS